MLNRIGSCINVFLHGQGIHTRMSSQHSKPVLSKVTMYTTALRRDTCLGCHNRSTFQNTTLTLANFSSLFYVSEKVYETFLQRSSTEMCQRRASATVQIRMALVMTVEEGMSVRPCTFLRALTASYKQLGFWHATQSLNQNLPAGALVKRCHPICASHNALLAQRSTECCS